MPTYEYGCNDCGHRFEQQQRITEAALVTCPGCGKDSLERIINASAFVLKGGGWYRDGYGSSSGASKRTDNDRTDRLEKAINDDKKKETQSSSSSSPGDSSKMSA